MRSLVPALVAVVVLAADGSAVSPASPVVAGAAVAHVRAPVSLAYQAPVDGPVRVLRPFDPPDGPYGPGHRGADLAVGGGPVRAAAAGTVTFAGRVAGRGVVVVAHADGIRTEYEPVTPAVRSGESVAAGAVLGRVSGAHAGCAAAAGGCLHWGARRGDIYLDPMALLRPLGPVRLLPWSPG